MIDAWRQAFALVGLVACVPAFAHSKLLSSSPAADAVLTQPPATLSLAFNEAVEIAFTTARLVGPSSQAVKLDAARDAGGDPSKVVAPLPPLAAGTWHVTWTTVGHDGHRVKGSFAFTIR